MDDDNEIIRIQNFKHEINSFLDKYIESVTLSDINTKYQYHVNQLIKYFTNMKKICYLHQDGNDSSDIENDNDTDASLDDKTEDYSFIMKGRVYKNPKNGQTQKKYSSLCERVVRARLLGLDDDFTYYDGLNDEEKWLSLSYTEELNGTTTENEKQTSHITNNIKKTYRLRTDEPEIEIVSADSSDGYVVDYSDLM
jgi:hypothetical protein